MSLTKANLLFGYRTTRKPEKVWVNDVEFTVSYHKDRIDHDGVLSEGLLFYDDRHIDIWTRGWRDTLLHEVIHIAILQAGLDWMFTDDLEEQLVLCLEKTLAKNVRF